VVGFRDSTAVSHVKEGEVSWIRHERVFVQYYTNPLYQKKKLKVNEACSKNFVSAVMRFPQEGGRFFFCFCWDTKKLGRVVMDSNDVAQKLNILEVEKKNSNLSHLK
jgi:hypothetical protein